MVAAWGVFTAIKVWDASFGEEKLKSSQKMLDNNCKLISALLYTLLMVLSSNYVSYEPKASDQDSRNT